MKHFVEARLDCLNVLARDEIARSIDRVCLVFDLEGRIRVALRPVQGATEEECAAIRSALEEAADIFWGNEIWQEPTVSPAPSEKALFEAIWAEARPEPPDQHRIYVLDRHYSKDAWLMDPFDPPWPLDGQSPPILSFYSFKGGVGRTTALLALAVNAARAGLRCVIVDFDLEAPGAGALACPRGGTPASYGIVDFLLEYPLAPDLDIAEYYHVCDDPQVIGPNGEPIYVVPAGTLDPWYLEKLARVNYESLYRTAAETDGDESPLHALLRALRSRLDPQLVLVDARAGLHDLGALSLSGMAHLQVLLGLHSEQSWQGLSLAIAHLGQGMVLAGKAQRDCAMIHAHAPFIEPGRQEQIRAFRERSFDVFRNHYYDPEATGEWPLPDPEDPDMPHYPAVLTWDQRIAGYRRLGDIALLLCEGEYRALCTTLLGKVGRSL